MAKKISFLDVIVFLTFIATVLYGLGLFIASEV